MARNTLASKYLVIMLGVLTASLFIKCLFYQDILNYLTKVEG